MTKEIEVIDQYGARHRFPTEGHYYEWRLAPGGFDIAGTDFLDVFRRCADDEDEFEVIATFPRPARVGVVTETTALVLPMPMREVQREQCPRCGFVARVRDMRAIGRSKTPNAKVSGAGTASAGLPGWRWRMK